MSPESTKRQLLDEAGEWLAGGTPEAGSRLLETLRDAAEQARARAYAPYSNYAVGAALLGEDGVVYTGCNVENASYGATICAERGAIAQMVAGGGRRALVCLVIGSGSTAVSPCGPCRQVLAEFNTPFVVSVGPDGGLRSWTMEQLLPDAMSRDDLA